MPSPALCASHARRSQPLCQCPQSFPCSPASFCSLATSLFTEHPGAISRKHPLTACPSCELPTILKHYQLKLHSLLYSCVHSLSQAFVLFIFIYSLGGRRPAYLEVRGQLPAADSLLAWLVLGIKPESSDSRASVSPHLVGLLFRRVRFSRLPIICYLPASFYCLIPSLTQKLHRVIPASLGTAFPSVGMLLTTEQSLHKSVLNK